MRNDLRKMGAKLDAEVSAANARAVKNAGKGAAESGRKAAVDYTGAFNKEINKGLRNVMADIPVDEKDNPWSRLFAKAREDVESLSKEKVGVSIDENTMFKSIENVRNRLRQLEDSAPSSTDFFNARSARARMDGIMGTVEEARRRGVQMSEAFGGAFTDGMAKALDTGLRSVKPVKVEADTTEAQAALQALRDRMETLSGKTIGVNISAAEAFAEIKAIHEALKALDREDVDIEVRADARSAAAGLARFRQEAEGSATAVSAMEQAVTLTMGRIGYLIMLGASLGSAIVPGALAAAGAVGFLGTSAAAAAAGVGVLALGVSGVGTAVQALDKYSQQTAKSENSVNQANRRVAGSTGQVEGAVRSLANTRRTVAQQNADAERSLKEAVQGVAQARHDGAISARDAARSTADAQRDLTRAEQDAKVARTDLNAAIDAARKSLRDLRLDLERNQVDQHKATTAQLKALNELNALRANPRASEVELRTAQDNYDEQTVLLQELAAKRQDLQDQQAKQQKLGVEGDDKVIAARKRVADQDEKVADAQVRVRRVRQDQDEKALQAQQRIDAAEDKVAQARRQRDRQRLDGAFQVAQAQAAVAAAGRSQAQALEKADIAGGAALDNLNVAMGQLTPTGQRFARFIFGLKDEFLQLRAAASDPMLPGFQTAIQMLLPYLPGVAAFIGKIAAELGSMAVQAAAALKGPVWRQFFSYINETAVPALQTWFEAGENILEGLLSIYLALTPLDGQIGRGLVGLSEDFAAWAANLSKSKGFQDFLDYVRDNGPKVVDFLISLTKAAVHLIEALAPMGTVVLGVFDGIVNAIDAVPTPVLTVLVSLLGAFALGITGIGAALRINKLKTQLGDIFGDKARSAVEKYAINTGLASSETGKFGKATATAAGSVRALYNAGNRAPGKLLDVFSTASSNLVEKYAIETGRATSNTSKFGVATATAGGLAAGFGGKVKGLWDKMGGLKGAAGGLMGFFGGPWGVALTGATLAISYFTAQSEKQQARVETLTDALKQMRDRYKELKVTGREAGASSDQAFKDIVRNNPEMQQAVVTLSKMGVGFDDIIKAANSGDPSQVISKLNDEIAKQNGLVREWEHTQRVNADPTAKNPFFQRKKDLEAVRDAFLKNATAIGLANEAEQILNQTDDRNAAITAIKNAHQKDGVGIVNEAIAAYDEYGRKIDHLNSFLLAFESGQGDVTSKAQALRDIIDDQTASLRGADEAASGYKRTLFDLTNTLKQNGRHLDDNTEAGLNNHDAIVSAAKAARELWIQDVASGMPMEKATARHKTRTDALRDEAAKGTGNKKAVDALVKSYGDVPPNVKTILDTGNFEKVYKQLQQMRFMQEMLRQGKTAKEAVEAWQAQQRVFAKAALKPSQWGGSMAVGGPVVGPGTGTSDDVLIAASNDEHMLTAAEVKAAGGHDVIYAWRKYLLDGGQLPGYRLGGRIQKRLPAYARGGRIQNWPFPVNVANTKIPTVEEIEGALFGGALGDLKGGQGYRWQMAVLHQMFPKLHLLSGPRPGARTLSGGLSWHARPNAEGVIGRAVDVDPIRAVAEWIRSHYGANTKELITPWPELGLWMGKPHQFSDAVQAQHDGRTSVRHVHWAYDDGGWLEPGAGSYVNATGRPEAVLNASQWQAVESQGSAMQQLVAQANTLGGRGNTYNFEFANSTLDAGRLRSIQQREDALARVGRPR